MLVIKDCVLTTAGSCASVLLLVLQLINVTITATVNVTATDVGQTYETHIELRYQNYANHLYIYICGWVCTYAYY